MEIFLDLVIHNSSVLGEVLILNVECRCEVESGCRSQGIWFCLFVFEESDDEDYRCSFHKAAFCGKVLDLIVFFRLVLCVIIPHGGDRVYIWQSCCIELCAGKDWIAHWQGSWEWLQRATAGTSVCLSSPTFQYLPSAFPLAATYYFLQQCVQTQERRCQSENCKVKKLFIPITLIVSRTSVP